MTINIPDNKCVVSKLINSHSSHIWLRLPVHNMVVPLPITGISYDLLVGTPNRSLYAFKGTTITKITDPSNPVTVHSNIGAAATVVGAWSNKLAWMTSDKKVWSMDPSVSNPAVTQHGTLPQVASTLVGNTTGLYAYIATGKNTGIYKLANGQWSLHIADAQTTTCSTLVGETIYWGGANLRKMSGSTLTTLPAVASGNITALAGVSMPHHSDRPDPDTTYIYAHVAGLAYCVFLTAPTPKSFHVPNSNGVDVKWMGMSSNGFLYWLVGQTVYGCNPTGGALIYLAGKPASGSNPVIVLPNAFSPITSTGTEFQFWADPPAQQPITIWKLNWADQEYAGGDGSTYSKTFSEEQVVSGTQQGPGSVIPIQNTNNNTTCDSLVLHVGTNDGGDWTVVIIDIDPKG